MNDRIAKLKLTRYFLASGTSSISNHRTTRSAYCETLRPGMCSNNGTGTELATVCELFEATQSPMI
jgi:hypothetical protein